MSSYVNDPANDVIQARPMQLTTVSGWAAGIGTVGAAVAAFYGSVAGQNIPPTIVYAIFGLVAVALLAFTIIVSVDMWCRTQLTIHARSSDLAAQLDRLHADMQKMPTPHGVNQATEQATFEVMRDVEDILAQMADGQLPAARATR